MEQGPGHHHVPTEGDTVALVILFKGVELHQAQGGHIGDVLHPGDITVLPVQRDGALTDVFHRPAALLHGHRHGIHRQPAQLRVLNGEKCGEQFAQCGGIHASFHLLCNMW